MTDSSLRIDLIMERLGEEGFETLRTDDDDVFQVKDPESGLAVTCALQDDILFNTLPCFTLPADGLTLELSHRLLDAGNGIATSSFQLFELPEGRHSVALTNFCKLQSLDHDELGEEDVDDVLSCLSFLLVDVVAARELLSELV